MLPKLALCLALVFILTAAPFSSAQEPAPATPPSADKPAAAPAQQPTKPATPPPTPAATPKKRVYTNDDLKGGPESFAMDFDRINDCDRNCFEQIHQLAHVVSTPGSNWKRDLLQAVDQVRKDSEWQQYLRDLIDMHLKFCALGEAKRTELGRVADPHNVTPQELSVDEKYERKFAELQASMRSLTSRQGQLVLKFTANPFALQFANVQASRITNASCAPQYYPNPADNDADP